MENLLKGLNVYLIGMMGAGKTTIGQLLAQKLGYRFLDTDVLIEKVAGQSIPEIFAQQGEAEFRELESKVLSEVSAFQHLVVATGGGIVLNRMNWSHLQYGLVIWLDVPVEELYNRLQGDTTRPLLQHRDPLSQLQNLLNQRQSLYAEADLTIPVKSGETPEEIVEQIFEEMPKVLKSVSENLN